MAISSYEKKILSHGFSSINKIILKGNSIAHIHAAKYIMSQGQFSAFVDTQYLCQIKCYQNHCKLALES